MNTYTVTITFDALDIESAKDILTDAVQDMDCMDDIANVKTSVIAEIKQ